MRLLLMLGMTLLLSGLSVTAARAAPVELVCKADAMETHLTIDVDAATATWANQTFQATITDTEVRWSGVMPVGNSTNGPTLYASFDRDTGTLVTDEAAGSDPATGIRWGSNHTTWACAKAQKIL